MEINKENIERHKRDIAFDQKRIEFNKRQLLDAEYNIKIWRIFKMKDELLLWVDRTNKFTLYKYQWNRLKGIQNKLKKQYCKF